MAVPANASVLAPPEAQDLPAAAVDHVVIMEVEESVCITCGAHRRTLTRSGSWVREERVYADRSETYYSDFASATSFRVVRNRQGEVVKLSAERFRDKDDYRATSRAATGRYDTTLGERCEIWALTSPFLKGESCETADGVQLWIRLGSVSSARATSVERLPVGAGDARAPADFFRLAPWPKPPADGRGGYEVRLVSTTRGKPRREVLRRQGIWGSGRSDSDSGTSLFWAADESSRFSYTEGADGRPLALEVALWSASLFSNDAGGRWERVRGRSARTVLGERCTWQENVSIRSTDVQYECRTTDGIPLLLEHHWHWNSIIDLYTAASLVRRPLTATDMAPPPASVDWGAWGVAR